MFDCATDTTPNHFPESSAQFKDGSKDNESDDKPSVPAAVSLFDKKDKPRKTKKIKRQSEIASNEVVTRKKARLSKDHHHDGSTSEVKQDDCKCGVKMEKKKRKSSTLKVFPKLYLFNMTQATLLLVYAAYDVHIFCCFMHRSPKMRRIH